MYKVLIILLSFLSLDGHAAGFTFLSVVSKSTGVAEHILTAIFISLVILVLGLFYRSKLSGAKTPLVPDPRITLRNLVEVYGQFIMDQCKAVIGEKEGPKYFGFVAALFLFIWFSNLSGLVPGFFPPTENLNTTLALGAIAFVYYNIKGCKEVGIVNYLKHFAGPLWYMAILIFPIEIISNFVRPISLALRLRGNISGDHLVMETFFGIFPFLVPIPALILGILVSTIQAYVFTILTMVYISLATAHHDHDEEHAH